MYRANVFTTLMASNVSTPERFPFVDRSFHKAHVMHSVLAKFALILLFVVSSNAHAVPQIGEAAPGLKGTLFSGKAFDLAAMRGTVVLINFYSSYCKFCAYEIGNIETYLEQNRDKGFTVIMVGVDRLEDRARVERMLGIYNLDGLMTDELEQSGFQKVYATPTAFVIDRQGTLRSKTRGAKLPSWYRQHVDPLLADDD